MTVAETPEEEAIVAETPPDEETVAAAPPELETVAEMTGWVGGRGGAGTVSVPD